MPRGPRGEKRPADVIGAEALPLFVETRCGGTCSARPYSDCVWCPHRRKRGHTYARAGDRTRQHEMG